eukprot:UN30854
MDKTETTYTGLDKKSEEMCNHYFFFGTINTSGVEQIIDTNILESRRCRLTEEIKILHYDKDFKIKDESMGAPTGIFKDSKGFIWIFHRAYTEWNSTNKNDEAITTETIIKVDPFTGEVLKKFGANRFIIPRGLYIDALDTLWVTDVAL